MYLVLIVWLVKINLDSIAPNTDWSWEVKNVLEIKESWREKCWSGFCCNSFLKYLLSVYHVLDSLHGRQRYISDWNRQNSCGSDSKESACNAKDLGLIPGLEDPLEEGMATHSSILAWRIPWIEEPGGLQPTGSQRIGHNWVTNSILGEFIFNQRRWINNIW